MRFRGCSLGLSLILVVASTVRAQKPPEIPNFREMFIKLDQNGDTILERGEIPDSGHAAFDRLLRKGDANKDGKLSADEMRDLGQKIQVLNEPDAVATRFAAMDKDGDGKLTRAEWKGVSGNFEKIDLDMDGSLTRKELLQFAADRGKPEPPPGVNSPRTATRLKAERFKKMDKNNDGRLSAEEFSRPRVFELLDSNKDGFLSTEEIARFKDQ